MMDDIKTKLPDVLAHFNIKGNVGEVFTGPLIYDVQFELAEGAKFSYVESLIKDIARELEVSGLRVSDVPNSKYISFEIPRLQAQSVLFAAVADSADFLNADYALPICMGVDVHGAPVIKDLSKMPHLLVAGTTGSGKSVGLNSFILSLIKKKTPEELQFVLIDPKRIEFSMYNNQKYMLLPVITEMSYASACLSQLVNEMNARYLTFEKAMVRNISEYHKKGGKMPYIVCVIDEFADLIMFDKAVEKQVQTLAQKSRAAGISLIIATQRPSVDVITGTIKANLPTRLSYKVSSPADSQTILNTGGAEDLLGRGDSLLLEENGRLTRVLGAYVSDEDINSSLQAYRCPTGVPQKYKDVFQNAGEQPSVTAAKTPEPEKKKGIFARIWDFWSRLGKRNQNRIINMIVEFVLSLLGVKSGGSSGAKNLKKTVRRVVGKK